MGTDLAQLETPPRPTPASGVMTLLAKVVAQGKQPIAKAAGFSRFHRNGPKLTVRD